jgi:hypothetical protein
MDKSELLQELESLSVAVKQRELSDAELESVSADVKRLSEKVSGSPPVERKRTLRDLKGVGKELWRAIDVDEYIRRERNSWDRR